MTDAPAVKADTRAWESSTKIDDSAIGKAQNTGPEMTIVDEESEINRLQMDSGCCGMSMLSDPASYPYGLGDGKVIRVHTAEKNVVRTAEKYGVAAGSVPTTMDLKTRRAGPRKAIRTGLAACAAVEFTIYSTKTASTSTWMGATHHTPSTRRISACGCTKARRRR